MAKAKKSSRKKPQKRGPKEDRLVVTDDPAEALQRLLKAKKPPPKVEEGR